MKNYLLSYGAETFYLIDEWFHLNLEEVFKMNDETVRKVEEMLKEVEFSQRSKSSRRLN